MWASNTYIRMPIDLELRLLTPTWYSDFNHEAQGRQTYGLYPYAYRPDLSVSKLTFVRTRTRVANCERCMRAQRQF